MFDTNTRSTFLKPSLCHCTSVHSYAEKTHTRMCLLVFTLPLFTVAQLCQYFTMANDTNVCSQNVSQQMTKISVVLIHTLRTSTLYDNRDPSAISAEIDTFPGLAGNRRVVTIGFTMTHNWRNHTCEWWASHKCTLYCLRSISGLSCSWFSSDDNIFDRSLPRIFGI